MLPVIALVGRPNVGKSTLFNRFTRTRDALVADLPGLTRDRQYGHALLQNNPFIIIDTGGITGGEVGVDGLMAEQSMQAVREADARDARRAAAPGEGKRDDRGEGDARDG